MEFISNVRTPFKTQGYYKVITRNVITNEEIKAKCFDINNTVTLEGRHFFFTLTTFRSNGVSPGGLSIGFGSGTTEILSTDTALGGTTAINNTTAIATVPVQVPSTPNTFTTKIERKAVFAPGTVTGTFGQVGMLHGGTLLAGQVLRDLSNNPTTVTFLDIEEVTVHYVIELTYTAATVAATADEMPTFVANTVNVNGTPYAASILAAPTWLARYNNENVLTNVSRGLNTIFLTASHLTKGVYFLVSDTDSSVETDWSYTGNLGGNGSPNHEVLVRGSRYKVTSSFTIPYTSLQDKYIKKVIAKGYFGGPEDVTNEYYNFGGGLVLDPPIFKGAGYELTIVFHVIYELV